MNFQEKVRKFWSKKTFLNDLLVPFGFIYYLGHLVNFHILQKPQSVRSMVICVGNTVIGGAGKTPFALALGKKLKKMGLKIAYITSGYKSSAAKSPIAILVNPKFHKAADVGDESLLLARVAPTYVNSNRYLAAAAAEADGARVIIMDDGLQNNTLRKNYTFLILDDTYKLGNGYPIPAGPLREPYRKACARADAVVLVTNEQKHQKTPDNLTLKNRTTRNNGRQLKSDFLATLTTSKPPIQGCKYFAFCGIAVPQKFFGTLKRADFKIAKTKVFDDHYEYSDADIEKLIANANGMQLITTEKDIVKIPQKYHDRIDYLPIELTFNMPEELLYRLKSLV
ncbi:MAG: lpxK [Candidatus Midichloriaceae bacterium]|jgi:tetraacyldisaccharide 4'-kinase|nr:lpxK [Candidatus Midichloriaceae bacterium]